MKNYINLPIDFDDEIYYKLHSDVNEMYKNNNIFTAVYHYIHIGFFEKRNYKVILPDDFDEELYFKLNADVKERYDNNNNLTASYHYRNYGYFENRKYKLTLPEDFEEEIYYKLNPDVKEQYLLNSAFTATFHYLNIGYFENRNYKVTLPEDFKEEIYYKLNPDVKEQNLVNSEFTATFHYLNIGYFENREYKVALSYEFDEEFQKVINLEKNKILLETIKKKFIIEENIIEPQQLLLENNIICFSNTILLNSNIPMVVHKIFLNETKDKIPEEIYNKAINSWKCIYPELEIKIYDNNDALNYILSNFGIEFVEVYNLLKPYAFKADFFRLCILYNEGGIYSDLKQQVVKRIDIDYNYNNFIYCEETYVSWIDAELDFIPIQNCFIGCCKKHPYIKSYLDVMIQNILKRNYGIACTDITGPITFGRVLNLVKKKWNFVNLNKEIKLYFNIRVENNVYSFNISDINYYTDNFYIKHKYDNSSGADWSKLNFDNNNYSKLWSERKVFNEKNNKFIVKDLEILDYLENFVLIIECHDISIINIITNYKCYNTFIFIDIYNDKLNIIINDEIKVRNSFTKFSEFIEKYNSKIDLLISNDNCLQFQKYFSSNKIINFYNKYDILKIKQYDFFLTKKYKKINTSKFINDIKPFMIYFPQFHKIKENDINFYENYSDIKNLELLNNTLHKKLPTPFLSELNINNINEYDLSNKLIIQRQIDIINDYDIGGFAIYYYWFSNNTITNKHMIMNNCIDIFFDKSMNLKNRKIFFIWANENWSKNCSFGDINNKEQILNRYTIENFIKNIKNLLDYFKNDAYLKIDNKPVLLIYHSFFMTMEEIKIFYDLINIACLYEGFNGIHLILNSMKNHNEGYNNFYMNVNYKNQIYDYKYYNNELNQTVVDYQEYVNSLHHIKNNSINTIFLDFDNRARFFKPNKLHESTYCINNSELNKTIFIKKNIQAYNRCNKEEIENILLINAWNEWGEKMSFEPSNEYGYSDLNLLVNCLKK